MYHFADQLNEIKHAKEELLDKWELPQHFKTRGKRNENYFNLNVKRSSLTFFAVESYTAFISEQADLMPSVTSSARCRVHDSPLVRPDDIKVTQIKVKEAKVDRTPSPKYHCRHCKFDVCRDCLKDACISHDVQWMGNKHFRCVSPHHRRQ